MSNLKRPPEGGKEQLILLRSERDASLDSHPLAAHAPLRGATGGYGGGNQPQPRGAGG